MSKYKVQIFANMSPEELQDQLNDWLADYTGDYLIIQYAVSPENQDFHGEYSALVTYEPSGKEEKEEEDAGPGIFSPPTGFDFFLMQQMRGQSVPQLATTTQALPPSFSYTIPLSPVIESTEEEL